MRVIAGSARGKSLATLKGDATRPTLERVKEAMFSAVSPWIGGAKVLDIFAGSGQLGLEALSRGAKHCVFVDGDKAALSVVSQNIASLGFGAQSRTVLGDALAFLGRCSDSFDMVLMDPPYEKDEQYIGRLLSAVSERCSAGAIVMCETQSDKILPQNVRNLTLFKQYKYGKVLLSRYHAPKEEALFAGEAL